MPQRDDRIGVHYGRISEEEWGRIKLQPSAIVEKAVALLAEARKQGKAFAIHPRRKPD